MSTIFVIFYTINIINDLRRTIKLFILINHLIILVTNHLRFQFVINLIWSRIEQDLYVLVSFKWSFLQNLWVILFFYACFLLIRNQDTLEPLREIKQKLESELIDWWISRKKRHEDDDNKYSMKRRNIKNIEVWKNNIWFLIRNCLRNFLDKFLSRKLQKTRHSYIRNL